MVAHSWKSTYAARLQYIAKQKPADAPEKPVDKKKEETPTDEFFLRAEQFGITEKFIKDYLKLLNDRYYSLP